MDNNIRKAHAVETPMDVNGESSYYIVGGLIYQGPICYTITKITVQEDLPGLHCNMRRVLVWVEDRVAVEIPLHNCVQVIYDLSEEEK